MEKWSNGKKTEWGGRLLAALHYSNTPSLRLLLSMWSSPRMLVFFAVTTVLLILARLPFLPMQLIPRHLDFQPGIVLVPLAAVFFGPAGVWGSLAASLLGDKLFGQWNALSW